ncbi:hypothetical protein F2Q68_00001812 [Brassica cretica]|uniref:HTH cro/C1-type domain-containing protein n=1 Tax=Brassica cretica TaxID=69181 RepID=A0A8S9JMD8_BRACR|nr:hypothetical protein F2Q68_00001812 [Brassica cretica]
MAGVGPMTQDWEPVVIRKRAPNSAAKRDEKTVNAARRSGADIESIINEKPQVIQEYESGKAIPNQQILSKLERALGAKLRGKK